MKQQVTPTDLETLTEEQKTKLRERWKQIHGTPLIPLLSIGQMIEFLIEHDPNGYCYLMRKLHSPEVIYDSPADKWKERYVPPVELCDALWEAVKAIL